MARSAETPVIDPTKDELMRRNREALALIESWANEDPEYDRSMRELLHRVIQESRTSTGSRAPDDP